MTKDLVCEMNVSEATAKAATVYQGKTYYFCSALCKQLFDREPQKYILHSEQHEHSSPVTKGD